MKTLKNYDDFKDQYLNEGLTDIFKKSFYSNIFNKIVDFFKNKFGNNAFAYIALFLKKKNKIPRGKDGQPKVRIITPGDWENAPELNTAENELQTDIGSLENSKVNANESLVNESLNDERYNIMVIRKDSFQINEGVKHPINMLNESYDDDIINIESTTMDNYTVQQLKDKIILYYNMAKEGDILSLFIWGAPGIGKTSITTEVARELDIMIQVWTLATLEPTDLKGVPTMRKWQPDPRMPEELKNKLLDDFKKNDYNFTETINALPMLLPTSDWNGRNNNGGILFFDEMNRAIQQVLDASLSLALDGKMDEYRLPNKWFVVAAGNRLSDIRGGNITPMEPAILNRFAHINFAPTFDDWKAYAEKLPFMDPDIIEFLESDDNFNKKTRDGYPRFYYRLSSNIGDVNEDPAMPTPRTWEIASSKFYNLVNIPEGNRGKRREEFLKWSGEDVLAPKTVVKGEDKNWDHKYEVDPEKLQKIFKRAVGEDAAKEFVKFHNKKAEEYRKELEKKRRENMENKNKGAR